MQSSRKATAISCFGNIATTNAVALKVVSCNDYITTPMQ